MNMRINARNRHQAWRIFSLQSGMTVVVVGLALVPALFMNDRRLALGAMLLGAAALIAISFFCATRLLRLLQQAQERADSLSALDELTGLPNRGWLFQRLDEELDRARRYGTPLSLILLDIDHFRMVNDHFGLPLGDEALTEVARLLRANVRSSDVVTRYSGEKFMIIVPQCNASQAAVVAEKLRVVVEVNDIVLEGPQLKLTVSCGVADLDSVEAGARGMRDGLVKGVEDAVVEAKEGGRNQVVMRHPQMDHRLSLV